MAIWLEKLRRWIDGVEDLSAAEKVLQDSRNIGLRKSKSELFLQKLLQEIEMVLKDEVTRIPDSKKAYVPPKFIVFISSDEEKSLPKDKREFFEQFLSGRILERAREIAGQLQLSAESIEVNVRVSADLKGEEVEVETFSDRFDKTFEISVRESVDWKTVLKSEETFEDLGTINDERFNFKPLYHLQIWRNGKMERQLPINEREISVGRDYAESSALIRLQTENRKISGLHTSIRYEKNGEVSVIALHKNPTVVAGKILLKGDTANLAKNNTIEIYDYTLRLKFTDK